MASTVPPSRSTWSASACACRLGSSSGWTRHFAMRGIIMPPARRRKEAAGVAGGLALALVFPGPGIVPEGDRPTQPLQAVDRMLQLLLQCPSDVVHGSALLRPK